jgi:hypothetical protein
VAKEALAAAKSTVERFYIAELHRLHGEVLAQHLIGQAGNADDAFLMIIRIARQKVVYLLERKAN